jgi:hypothetical protein
MITYQFKRPFSTVDMIELLYLPFFEQALAKLLQ